MACAASPINSVRLRDQVGKVATSSVSVTTMLSAASTICGTGSCQPAWKSQEMLPQLILAHGAEISGGDAVRGLRAPPHHAVGRIRAAKAVAEEAALAERRHHALTDRRVLEQRSRRETAEADQAGVEWLWTVRNHMRPHCRMHAVGADQKIALGAGAVGEMRDDRLVGPILDMRQPFVEMQRGVGAPGFVDQRLVEGGAAHVDGRLAETRFHVAVDRAQPAARLRIEIEGFGDRAAADHFVGEAKFGQHMHAVRRDLQAAADPLGVGPGFINLGVDAGLLQENRGDRAGDAGADDQGFAGRLGHALLHASVW